MSLRNKNIVKDYYEKIVNTGNTERLTDFVSESYTEVYNGKRYEIGISGAREHILGVLETYAGFKLTILKQIAEKDTVVTQYHMEGTMVKEWNGIQPTGKKIEVTGVDIDTLKDGRIIEHDGAVNLLDPFMQTGAVVPAQ